MGRHPAEFAPLFAAGLFGLMAGAFVFGPLADRFGRKPVLALTTVFFSLATLASAVAPDMHTLTMLRFITGLGLGGAMPAAITLTAELCPEQRRSSLVTLMFCGFTVGSASAGLAASSVVASFAWPGLLVLDGAMPLVLAAFHFLGPPESPRYLATRGAPRPASPPSCRGWRPSTPPARHSPARSRPRVLRSASCSRTGSASARC